MGAHGKYAAAVGRLLVGASIPVLMWAASRPAHATDFTVGGWQGSFDTTVSIGVLDRVQDRDKNLIGRANGGNNPNTNIDNGDLNYGTGPVSAPLRATQELKLDKDEFGFFARTTEFVDFVNMDAHNTDFRPLSHEAVNQAGFGGRLLDAYSYGHVEPFDHRVDFRIGRTALNWGESTFIPGGINAFNPFDVTALRSPGSELREAILPIPVTDFATRITNDLSVEAYYQWQWQKTDIDPNGTYFSTEDLASPGSNYETLNGDLVDARFAPDKVLIPGILTSPGNLVVPRGLDHEPSNWNQYGVALRYTAPWLNATEFGLYYLQAASNLPILNWTAGPQAATQAGIAKGLGIVTSGIGKALAAGQPQLVGPILDAATGVVGGYAIQSAGEAARYFVSYPSNIKTPAVSFSSQIGSVSIQGEYSYKLNVPLQINFADLTQAGLAPSFVEIGKAGGPATLASILAGLNTNALIKRAGGITAENYTKFFNFTWLGYERHDVQQAQLTATNVWGPHFGADQIVFVGEVGADYVPGLESHEVLPFEGPLTPQSANPNFPNTQPSDVQHGGFPTKFSWGYRLRVSADFLRAIGAINLTPSVAFNQDINGISPGPGPGNFIAGRKAVDLALRATYQNAWAAELSYTNYFGGKGQDPLTDRDFVQLNIKYSF
jgi:hypothetical protein